MYCILCFFFFQAEDGIRDLVRSRGLGDVYKRQTIGSEAQRHIVAGSLELFRAHNRQIKVLRSALITCLLYTSDAADERSSVDLGGRRIIKKKTKIQNEHNSRAETPNDSD